jgi:thiol-disulfide isomerase/thioredoxin
MILSCAVIVALFCAAPLRRAGEHAKPKVIGLLFYADWCGSCKVLEPKPDAVKKDFTGQPILFTRVDLTDDFTREQSALYASWVGLKDSYAAHGAKTGFMLLIDAQGKKVLDKLTPDQSEDELRAAITSALAK